MNLPNKITVARIVMIFIFLIVCNVDGYIADKFGDEIGKVWRITGVVFAMLAGLTDILDGYIARKYNLVTDFGRLMDPLADKIFMATTFIMLVDKQILEAGSLSWFCLESFSLPVLECWPPTRVR